jgi:hypothetical protein
MGVVSTASSTGVELTNTEYCGLAAHPLNVQVIRTALSKSKFGDMILFIVIISFKTNKKCYQENEQRLPHSYPSFVGQECPQLLVRLTYEQLLPVAVLLECKDYAD